MLEVGRLDVDCHATVVSDMLAGAGGIVVKRCLAAVGVADKGHVDYAAFALGEVTGALALGGAVFLA